MFLYFSVLYFTVYCVDTDNPEPPVASRRVKSRRNACTILAVIVCMFIGFTCFNIISLWCFCL